MKIGLLFSGQGAQQVGMGADLYANVPEYQQVIDRASQVLGYDLAQLTAEDEQKLAQTQYVQPAILAMSTGIITALGDTLPKPIAGLGLSLGEYSALTAAGVMDYEQAVAIIKDRGAYMQAVGNANPGKMVAIMGDDQALIEGVLEKLQSQGKRVYAANYNTFAQLVIGGIAEDVDEAVTALTEAGIKRTVALPVSGAFHTPLLQEAADQLGERIADETFHEMTFPIYSNTTSDVFDIDQLHDVLTRQLMSPTYFAQALQKMLDAGVDTLIEVGPSSTLIKFAKKIAPKTVKRYAITDLESFNEVKALLTSEEGV
ncbi:ACP S-malonyltransferase [Leuconostoc fallax]|uniref:Malonyl CoA-acyl carrier protein transacylase n=1 Tax=Leuconostoc fallax TaxID=1251 RepID=A0A4R5NAR4_9LACO|nr:ACP S-malonyltransferase [Leuconostoc fallax]MBU7454923.1 ACP S-malonyltransferase [Leuconostoc fallax]MCO6183195.1 ACP S-malonyltransferase [Leuconostoc fallax]TDG69488.1 hypothetical protein C5L23_000950 [Leuconostoc fallax]